MADPIDARIIRERIEDLRVYKRDIKTDWELIHESLLTRSVLHVVHSKSKETTIIRVIYDIRVLKYFVVSNPRGEPRFTYTEAPTHEDVVNTINRLIQDVSQSGL